MSAVNCAKAKTNCDAVNSGHFIINQPIRANSSSAISKHVNNGAKLSQKQNHSFIKQETSIEITTDYSQKFSDVQKVLKQEQELQKQLYSGSNVAPGWLRVNHNNKVIYIRWVPELTLHNVSRHSKNHVAISFSFGAASKSCTYTRSERKAKMHREWNV